jgi:3-isopropylmalate/(R)-2-methylmalate dehydratase small subunit
MIEIKGKAWKFGNNIDTDVIVSGQYLKLSLAEAAEHVMESASPNFKQRITAGDIMVAGTNFGCGSSRESAPAAIKEAGIGAVVAVFFARIFYRNAINIGLPVFECPQAEEIQEGDQLEFNLEGGEIYNLTQQKTYKVSPFPDRIMQIISSGGLISMLSKK